jgi:hypothetical protein
LKAPLSFAKGLGFEEALGFESFEEARLQPRRIEFIKRGFSPCG